MGSVRKPKMSGFFGFQIVFVLWQVLYIMAVSSTLTDEEAEKLMSVRDPGTKNFVLQHAMYRIKDPKKSLKFYSEVLGMTLLTKIDFPSLKYTYYFIGHQNPDEVPKNDADKRMQWAFSKISALQLTHIWGTENNASFSYHDGNTHPMGYGHIGIVVPDVEEASKLFEKYKVEFVKKSNEGKLKGPAFIKDPDGYWIEIMANKPMKDPGA